MAVGAGSFALFCLTVSPTIGIGPSPWLAAHALGLFHSPQVSHPLTLLLNSAVAGCFPSSPLLALRLFSAALFSVSAALFFMVCRKFFLHEPEDGPGGERSGAPFAEQMLATFAALLATAAAVTSSPVRLAATQQSVWAVPCLLLMLAVNQLIALEQTGRKGFCYQTAFLLGVGAVESPALLLLAPALLGLTVWLMGRKEGMGQEPFLVMMLYAVAGAALMLALILGLSGRGPDGQLAEDGRVVIQFAHGYLQELQQMFPPLYWMYGILPGMLLPPVAFACVRNFHGKVAQRLSALVTADILMTLMTIWLGLCLMDLWVTPWSLCRAGNRLPVLQTLAIAANIGCVVVFWGLHGTVQLLRNPEAMRNQEAEAAPRHFVLPQTAGMIFSVAILALVCFSAVRHWEEGNAKNAAFLDKTAAALLESVPDGRILLCDDVFDLHVKILAKVRRRSVAVLSGGPSPNPFSPAWAQELVSPCPFIVRPKTDEGAAPKPALDWAEWLRQEPGHSEGLFVQRSADLWREAGFLPVPLGFVYGGVPPEAALPPSAWTNLCAKGLARLETLKLDNRKIFWPALRQRLLYTNRYLSRMSNDLGVWYDANRMAAEADRAYELAQQFNLYNVSAALNQYALRLQNPGLGPTDTVLDKIQWMAHYGSIQKYPDRIFYLAGALARQQPDLLLSACFSNADQVKRIFGNTLRLVREWILMTRPLPKTNPLRPTTVGNSGGPRTVDQLNSKLARIFTIYADGQTDLAERLLELYLTDKKQDLDAWALQAEILLSRGDAEKVRVSVLPGMKNADLLSPTGKTSLLTELVEGFYEMGKAKPDYRAARECFSRAAAAEPKAERVADCLLEADMRGGYAVQAKADILLILERQPKHPAAMALLGSLRLSEGKLDEAERLLKTSLASADSATAENDLAEIYHRRGDMKLAEAHIRHAIQCFPFHPLLWNSLGILLSEQKRTAESNVAFSCSKAFASESIQSQERASASGAPRPQN